jgi:hypothetical protein
MPHEKLSTAYPEISNIVVRKQSEPGGSYSPTTINNRLLQEDIYIGEPAVRKVDDGFAVSKEQGKSINLHELQHAIQQREGWAKGGSPSQLSDISSTLAGNALNKLNDVSAKHPALRKAYNLMNQTQDALLEKYKLSRFNPSDMTFNQRAGMDFMKKATPEDKAVWKEANDAYWQVLKDSPVQKEFADAAVKAWQSNIPIDPHTAYRRLAGEAESRLTQSRMNLDAQQRLQNYPYDIGQYGLDVPIDQLIVRGLLK